MKNVVSNARTSGALMKTKHGVSEDTRKRVLDLRQSHSLRGVSERTGLPIGTVKTICSRSGCFRDNPTHRAMFTLPPMRERNQSLPAVQKIPEQKAVTGDTEVDAVLWLREVISTGNAGLIERAMEAAKQIKTPLKELEQRYSKHLVSISNGNTLGAVLGSLGFADLEDLAERAIERSTKYNEAKSRFGERVFDDTEAERFCVSTLSGVGADKYNNLNELEVDSRFHAHQNLMPHTLADCLYELKFWNELYSLRNASSRTGNNYGDHLPTEASAREDFAFRCLAKIRPRNSVEAIDVFRYLTDDDDRMEREETHDILLNLIGNRGCNE